MSMRSAAEGDQWSKLKKRRAREPAKPSAAEKDVALDLNQACTILAGRNGAGKSRLLRSLEEELDSQGLLLDIHHLTEQALILLRSRIDFEDMAKEAPIVGPDAGRLDDVQRVVGREYEYVEWYALEVEPADDAVAERFRWSGEQAVVPYFRVSYRGVEYTSRDMGLGEFSMHFVLWILEHYREEEGIVLLLDEPDAYLPPIGVSALLGRLLRLAFERNWTLIISSHSEELIAQAIQHDSLVLLEASEQGAILGTPSQDNEGLAEQLLARPTTRLILFCEDESACYLVRSLLDVVDRRLSRSTVIIWGDGHGFLRQLHAYLPRQDRPVIRFGYVFDGDQTPPELDDEKWSSVCLPSDRDPDALFKSLSGMPAELASEIGIAKSELTRRLTSLEGTDPHDWVNGLASSFGRERVLRGLADLWCRANSDLAARVGAELVHLGRS